MKLSTQVKRLVEDQSVGLSSSELKSFWKDMQENVFKYSKELVKEDRGLFFGSTEIELSKSNGIESLKLESVSPIEIVQMVLNDYTLNRESNEEDDSQAFEYFLKNLKGEEVYIYGEAEEDGSDVKYEGTVKINNFKYNPSEETLSITDYKVVTFKTTDI